MEITRQKPVHLRKFILLTLCLLPLIASDALHEENEMLKERVQDLQIEIQKLKNSEKLNASIYLIQTLQEKMIESDKHLRMTLDRLTEEHMRS